MVGWLCTSLAGHDRDVIYVIIKEEKEYIYVADGRFKTMTSPKKKNKKHIQLIKKEVAPELQDKIRNQEAVRDEEIKRIITLYKADGRL